MISPSILFDVQIFLPLDFTPTLFCKVSLVIVIFWLANMWWYDFPWRSPSGFLYKLIYKIYLFANSYIEKTWSNQKMPWRRKWEPTPVFSPGKSHGQSSLVGYSPWGHKRVRHKLATKKQQQIRKRCMAKFRSFYFVSLVVLFQVLMEFSWNKISYSLI